MVVSHKKTHVPKNFPIRLGVTLPKGDYYPFGKEARGSSSANEPKEGFTSKEHDAENDLQYFGSRYYNSTIAKWISPDPLAQYPSPYVYVGNNPINLVDPKGLWGETSQQAADQFLYGWTGYADNRRGGCTFFADQENDGKQMPSDMTLSPEGEDMLTSWEQVAPDENGVYKPYADYTEKEKEKKDPRKEYKAKVNTVGFGHLIQDGENFDKGLTYAEVVKLFKSDIKKAQRGVTYGIHAKLYQTEFDALVIYQFNSGALWDVRSLVAKGVNEGSATLRNTFSNSRTSTGIDGVTLNPRRQAEVILFFDGRYTLNGKRK